MRCKLKLTIMFVLKCLELIFQVRTHNQCIFLKVFLFNHFENSMTGSCADGITTKGVEVASLSQDSSNFWSRNHSTYWYAVPSALKRMQ